jgi:hypothetical protein
MFGSDVSENITLDMQVGSALDNLLALMLTSCSCCNQVPTGSSSVLTSSLAPDCMRCMRSAACTRLVSWGAQVH